MAPSQNGANAPKYWYTVTLENGVKPKYFLRLLKYCYTATLENGVNPKLEGGCRARRIPAIKRTHAKIFLTRDTK